ncbi:hypothetical protein [Ectobacillus panaciterrae]|uniref:hypothetical protein n=1 Tax=Ectobacillus panaciterrae TaxID=363872 RepID=UPI000408BA0D|nr:hypothetical protein [Ectobacillus panaciterrae]
MISELNLESVLNDLKQSGTLGAIGDDSHLLKPVQLPEVSCFINKYKDDQSESKEWIPYYLIHKNTLGQMIYEAFVYKQEEFKQFFTPAILILSNKAVEGFKTPGIYLFHADEEKYTWQGGIPDELSYYFKLLQAKYDLNLDLAIGYFAKSPCLGSTTAEMASTLLASMDRLAQLLLLHGGLKELKTIDFFHHDSQEISPSSNLSNLMCVFQWIQEITKNHTELDAVTDE